MLMASRHYIRLFTTNKGAHLGNFKTSTVLQIAVNNVNDTSYVLLRAQERCNGEVLLTVLSRSAERQELINS